MSCESYTLNHIEMYKFYYRHTGLPQLVSCESTILFISVVVMGLSHNLRYFMMLCGVEWVVALLSNYTACCGRMSCNSRDVLLLLCRLDDQARARARTNKTRTQDLSLCLFFHLLSLSLVFVCWYA